MTSNTLRLVPVVACLSLVNMTMAACDNNSPTRPKSPDPIPPPPAVATRVQITPPSAELDAIGQTIQLTAKVFDQYDSATNEAVVTWSSGHASVAIVNTQGLVTAVKNGTAVITARSGNANASANVTVKQTVSRIVIEPGVATLESIGATVQFTASVLDAKGSPVEGAVVTWSSGDMTVATVNNTGMVTAVANGTVRITARSEGMSASINVTVASLSPSPDRDVLMAFYRSTGGPLWINNSNWLSETNIGEWFGVDTDINGRVSAIRLGRNNLTGSIPPEIGQLTELRVLILTQNSLEGSSLPIELGQLSNLEELVIANDQIEGSIPAELAKLTNLRFLSLSRNQLTGSIPAELGRLTNLEILVLSNNQLTGSIPVELGKLSNLEQLYLEYNQLTGSIPAELGKLSNLVLLNLNDNQLSGDIPSELGQLTNLKTTRLGFNPLTGSIPHELGQLSNLEVLELRFAKLTGSIPAELGQLRNLTHLNLDNNLLTGSIPPELGQMNNLKLLNLSHNRNVVSQIPAELGQLNNLEALWLGSMGLIGAIPPELGGLQNLKHLYLFVNQLSGRIPPELGRLTKLEILWLNHNRLTGELPSELGDLLNLRVLSLWKNPGLTGPIPESLTRVNLVEFRTSGTQLCAPQSLDFQMWLQRLDESALVLTCRTPMNPEVYLTQAVQSFDRPVPLVEGEEALLRVFFSSEEPDVRMPPVRATFYINGTEEQAVDIPSESVSVPDHIEEGSLAHSANAPVPADMIRPGLEMVIEIVHEDMEDYEMGIGVRVPETGRMAVDVRTVPPMDLVLVPMLWTEDPAYSIVSRLEGLTEDDDLLRWTRDLLPVRDLEVIVKEPLYTSTEPVAENVVRLLEELESLRVIDGGEGYYMGIIESNTELGAAFVKGRGSVSVLDGKVMAHELGHNMSLQHAPCDVSHELDRNFPYPGGAIGAWGYDFSRHVLINPSTPDLMGYCYSNPWISDYHFKKAINYRVHREAPRVAAALTSDPRSLLLWGGLSNHGELYLEPAFVVNAQPSLPKNGPFSIAGEDADGNTLFTLDFAMSVVADANDDESFVFTIPIQRDWSDRLTRIALSGPGGYTELTRDSGASAALLLDQSTGEVRGILRDRFDPGDSGRTAFRALPEPGMVLIFSRGVPDPSDW